MGVADDALRALIRRSPAEARAYVEAVLAEHGGNQAAVCRAEGWSSHVLRYEAIAALGIHLPDDEPLRPTRHQLLMALLANRGRRDAVAEFFGASVDWVDRAVAAYDLGALVPPVTSPYWSLYEQ